MTCGRQTEEYTTSILVTSTTPVFFWMTDWIACTGLDKWQGVLRMLNRSSTHLRLKLAYQVAEVLPDVPDAPTVIASPEVTQDEAVFLLEDAAAVTAAHTFIRLGFAGYLDSGSTPETADVTSQYAFGLRGKLIGNINQQVLAPDSTAIVIPVTDWVPTLETQKAKAALVVSSGVNLSYQVAYQTAATIVSDPGAWTDLEGGYTTGDGLRCTGELTPTITDKMWIRLGLKIKASTGVNKPGFISGSFFNRS